MNPPGTQEEITPRECETRVSCSGVGQLLATHTPWVAQCGEQRRLDLKHIKNKTLRDMVGM